MTTASVTTKVKKIPTKWWQWWPLLLGWLGMLAAYVFYNAGAAFYNKANLEKVAIVITATGAVLACVHLIFRRDRYHLLLLALTVTVMFREFHWEWTTKFVYISIAVLGVTAVIWHKQVFAYVDRQPIVRVWLVATALTYVLSQAIARRAFRGVIPDEQAVYSVMEELVEDVSHAMLLITTLLGPWRRASPEPDSTAAPTTGASDATT